MQLRRLFLILITITIVSPITVTAATAPKIPAPDKLLETKLDTVITILQDKNLDLTAKEAKIDKLVTPIFDFPLMSYLTLGKSNWTKMTKDQKARFSKLFRLRLKDSYREKLLMYNDEKILYKKPQYTSKTRVVIPTEIIRQESNIDIVYKMHNQKNKGWKIYEVEVQGISLVTTYKSQFGEMLSKGTIDDLIAKLAQPNPEQAPVTAQK